MEREEKGSSLAETVSTNSPQRRQTSQGSPLNKVQLNYEMRRVSYSLAWVPSL